MKILKSLFGLALFAAGVAGVIWLYGRFDQTEPLMIGAILGGAFVTMVLGLFLFLLQFHRKAEVPTPEFSDEDAVTEEETAEAEELVEPETEDLLLSEEPIELLRQEQEELFQASPLSQDDEAPDHVATSEAASTTDTLKLFYNEPVEEPVEPEGETVDCRLIGIDSWGAQRLLRRLDEGTEVQLHMKPKNGLMMAEILYEGKSLGVLSKVELHKIEDAMPRLQRITLENLQSEDKKIIGATLRFHFRQK